MLVSLRRCSASIPRLSRSIVQTSRHVSSLPPVPSSRITVRSSLAPLALRSFSNSPRRRNEAENEAEAEAEAEPIRPLITEFRELGERALVHPTVVRNITVGMGISKMTDVQTATINEALAGQDIVAQARTGTGKTLAFLMPILQRIIAEDPRLGYGRHRTSPSDIRAIIISPTRELAEQIAVEAERVTEGTGIVVQRAVGGTQKNYMLQLTQRQGCHLLIGTPGRLNDLLSDSSTGLEAPKLSMFVLDEADRLLDDGFWPSIQAIRDLLPDPEMNNIQTLMFSATVPQQVIGAVRETLKPGFRFVKCVRDNESQTHENIEQNVVIVAALENEMPTLVELCAREIVRNRDEPGSMPFKAIVYFPSTAGVELSFQTLWPLTRSILRGTKVLAMHGKLTQGARTRASQLFREAESAILLSSDVTARGMDFPNVSHVIQIGLPSTSDDYIHRVGRTGRAGKPGTGYLIVNPLQQKAAKRKLGHLNLPFQPDHTLECAKVNMTAPAELSARVAAILTAVTQAFQRVDRTHLAAAFRALYGVYQSVDDKQLLVDKMNQLSRYGWGLASPPQMSQALVNKLGLRGVDGIEIGEARLPPSRATRHAFARDRRDGFAPFGSSNGGNMRGSSQGRGSHRGPDAFDRAFG